METLIPKLASWHIRCRSRLSVHSSATCPDLIQAKNWQGEIPESGIPLHPTRQVLRRPPVFEFDGPVIGTYPPWTDPSYWNEGLQWHFKLKPQMEVLGANVASEIRILLRTQPALVTGILVLALLSGRPWLAGLRELWPLIVLPLAAMVLYLPVHVEDRFLGGFVLILFLTCLAAVRLRPPIKRLPATSPWLCLSRWRWALPM